MSTYTQQIFNSFGEAFSYALDIIKESPEDFSNRTGIDKGQISRYVNNKKTPRPKTVNKIVQLLGIEIQKKGSEWHVLIPSDAQKAIDKINLLNKGVSDLHNSRAGDKEVVLTEDDSPTLIRLRKKYPELRHIIDKEIGRLLNNSDD